ncbi:MAG TPA: tyrosine-type recombinase/integrase [Gammaproteobacteria bacterium]|nr:tyrosine-type recombinase/integrase [Gammaproteobacteria bacterium]
MIDQCTQPLQAEEADKLCEACESLEEKLIVWTLLDTGMRISELCNLKAEQILRQKKAIRINGRKSQERVVPMSKRVQTLLDHYFAINNHWPVGTRQAQKIVKQVAEKAKLSRMVTPHTLRRTFFENFALQKGLSLADIKEILVQYRLRDKWNVRKPAVGSYDELFQALHDRTSSIGEI